MVRRACSNDLPEILRLYRHLNPDDPVCDPDAPNTQGTWKTIMANSQLAYFVAEADGKIVSTCNLTIVPNLTRGLRPYGLIENVVTDPAYERRGFGTMVLTHALNEAWAAGCYKVMLLTSSRREATLRFYAKAGFRRGVKTGFIAYAPKA